jgi:hypothetical protein
MGLVALNHFQIRFCDLSAWTVTERQNIPSASLLRVIVFLAVLCEYVTKLSKKSNKQSHIRNL